MSGYSTTPLAKKLGIKPGTMLFTVNAPDDYLSLLAPLPQDLVLANQVTADVDLIHLFVKSKKQLASSLKTWRKIDPTRRGNLGLVAQEGGADTDGSYR